MDIVSAPAVGSAATIRFFLDHQRTSPGSFPNLDWPILLGEAPLAADGAEMPAGLLIGAADASALERTGVRRVRFTTERAGFDASSVNILTQELKADRAANTAPAPGFRAKLIIAIYAGNVDLTRIPTGFLNAWSTAAGVPISEQTMRQLLNGTLSMDEALRFALKPLTEPIDFNAIVRMTEMMRRNVLRAA
jgi:hypothetical protein